MEIVLRALNISYPSFYVVDDYTGATLRPGARGWWRQEGEAYIRINSDGLRDRGHAKPKPLNTFRIAVLGDSFTEAKQVEIRKTFWAVMEKDLEQCAGLNGQQVEVINFGVSGFGTAEELLTLRHRVWPYHPDLVLLALYTGNDIRENSRALNYNPLSPYFIYSDGELVLDNSFLHSPDYLYRKSLLVQLGYGIINYSRVLQLANQAKNVILTKRKTRAVKKELTSASDGNEAGIQNEIYREPAHSLWQEAWQVTEGLITLMRDEVAEKGADFLVVTLSTSIQVHPDSSVRKQFMISLGIDHLFYPDFRIKALGEREGISVLNLAPSLQAYAQEHQIFLHGFENATMGYGHWNENGHRLAGQIMAQKICEQYLRTKARVASTP